MSLQSEPEGREYRGHMLEVLVERVSDLKRTLSAAFTKYDALAAEIAELKTAQRVQEAEDERDAALAQRQWEIKLEEERGEFEKIADAFRRQIGEPEDAKKKHLPVHQRIDSLQKQLAEVIEVQAKLLKWVWRLLAGVALAVASGQIDTAPLFAVIKATIGIGG